MGCVHPPHAKFICWGQNVTICEDKLFTEMIRLKSGLEGKGNPLQYSCLKNPVDGGAR